MISMPSIYNYPMPENTTNVFSYKLHNDVMRLIISRLTLIELQAFMKVDRWCRSFISNNIKNIPILEAYKRPPLFNMEQSTLGKLDVIAAHIDNLPIFGLVCSIPRTAIGLLAAVGFGIGKGVCHLTGRLNDEVYCERQAIRASKNFVRGLYCLSHIPVLLHLTPDNPRGELGYDHVMQVEEDNSREFFIQSIYKANVAIKWIEYTREYVLPKLVHDKKIDFGLFEASFNRAQKDVFRGLDECEKRESDTIRSINGLLNITEVLSNEIEAQSMN